MKSIWIIALLFTSIVISGQSKDVNIQNKYGAAGYDLVSYTEKKAIKGNDKFMLRHNGVVYRFSSKVNSLKFEKDPVKFLPQYGGWCAYAMATKGEKVKVNPKTFELRNGKLYLFYDAYFNNTYEDWIEEGPEELVIKADKNWASIVNNGQ
jgi:YHS domain-containing protein